MRSPSCGGDRSVGRAAAIAHAALRPLEPLRRGDALRGVRDVLGVLAQCLLHVDRLDLRRKRKRRSEDTGGEKIRRHGRREDHKTREERRSEETGGEKIRGEERRGEEIRRDGRRREETRGEVQVT
jgi:hypothetical protein